MLISKVGDKPLVIISGASRGIGLALAKIASKEFDVWEVGRQSSSVYPRLHWDLSTPFTVQMAHDFEKMLGGRKVFSVVSCAGVVTPLGDPDAHLSEHRSRHLADFLMKQQDAWSVNFHSLQSLTEFMLPYMNGSDVLGPPRMAHLTTGAAKRVYRGMETYCLSKSAALGYFHQLAQRYPCDKLLALSIAPGTVRTEMMGQVLGIDPNHFQDFSKFHELDSKNELVTPDATAQKVFDVLFKCPAFKLSDWHGAYLDVRTLPLT
jgi:NAD(P)-dependent dehydrogenase (short-subunit alcohol dehydrogenase family)